LLTAQLSVAIGYSLQIGLVFARLRNHLRVPSELTAKVVLKEEEHEDAQTKYQRGFIAFLQALFL
jgi:hypothetical protein